MREVVSSNPGMDAYRHFTELELHLQISNSLLQYLETNGETGGFAIYCQPRHKGSLTLSQDSVGGVLEERSHYVLDSTSGEAGQYRCRPNQERVT